MKWLDDNKITINTFLLCAVVACVPFKNNIGNLSIILALIFNIIFFERKNLKKLNTIGFLFPLLFFIWILISSIVSKDHYGIRRLDLEILPLVITVIIINFKFNHDNLLRLFKVFYTSTVVSVMILLFYLGFKFLKGNSIESLNFHNFTSLYDQHPVFYSMYLSFAFFLSINNNLTQKKVLKILGNTTLILGIIFCASKTVLLFSFVTISIYLLKKYKPLKSRIFTISILFCLTLIFFNISFIEKRFSEGLKFNNELIEFQPTNDITQKRIFTYSEKESISDLELRYLLGKIGLFHQYHDNKMLFGYGKGDSRDYLNYYLFTYNLGPNWFENFNLHNQYLDILFNMGVLALILFLLFITYSIWFAVKSKDINYIYFILMISFVFVFDAPLTINKGIVYFYLFNAIFIFKNLTIESSHFRNARNPKLSWRI